MGDTLGTIRERRVVREAFGVPLEELYQQVGSASRLTYGTGDEPKKPAYCWDVSLILRYAVASTRRSPEMRLVERNGSA